MALALPPPVPAPVANHGRLSATGNLVQELEAEAQALADLQREETGFFSAGDEPGASASRPPPDSRSGASASCPPPFSSPRAGISHADKLLMKNELALSGQDLTEMLSRLETEGAQLASWGATLHREHARLERENVELEVRAEEFMQRRQRLGENHADLEQFVGGLEACLREESGLPVAAPRPPFQSKRVAEHEAEWLRRELSTRADEIDQLRAECQNSEEVLSNAQAAAFKATAERDQSRNVKAELEKDHREIIRKQSQVDRAVADGMDRNRALEDDVRELRQKISIISRELHSVDAACADADREACRLERVIAERESNFATLQDLVGPLEETVQTLMTEYVEFTRESKQMVDQVKARHNELVHSLEISKLEMGGIEGVVGDLGYGLADLRAEFARSNNELQRKLRVEGQEQVYPDERLLQRSREWLEEKSSLENDLAAVQERIAEKSKNLDELLKDKRRRSLTLRRRAARDADVTREVRRIKQGMVLGKVSLHQRGRLAKRFVCVNESGLELQWMKELTGPIRGRFSKVDLRTVIRIDYGMRAKANALHHDLPPWLCFSIQTPWRSYDFVGLQEDCIGDFVLGLSKLCTQVCTPPLPSGAIRSRSQWLFAKVFCKIDYSAAEEGLSREKLLLRAIRFAKPSARKKSSVKVKGML